MARDEAYQRAEQRIEEARRLGARRLALGNMGLTELPKSIGQLKQLRELEASANQLTTLPETIGDVSELRKLWVWRSHLTSLPDSVGQLKQLQVLDLSNNKLKALPESLGQLKELETLDLSGNSLTFLPESLGQLERLKALDLSGNNLMVLPESLSRLKQLKDLNLSGNNLTFLPETLGQLAKLSRLDLTKNRFADLPLSLAQMPFLSEIRLAGNPLSLELKAAYEHGLDDIKRYLYAKAQASMVLNEAKLILIGEGEVGKSCLLGALRGDPWKEDRPTTHGIEIKPVKVTDQRTGTEIMLNGWDFGGQRVYRPTHQLFFSAPAVYLVVWKPREGSQQGSVKEWINLVKHREPDAKILVVATHGGPKERQPDIDRQELWDLFGKETVVDFFHVESRPPKFNKKTKQWIGIGRGINELRLAIANVATRLPEMGRTFPENWQKARRALQDSSETYLPLKRVYAICREHKVEGENVKLLLRICRRVGDLIHFDHDPTLRDIVVLKPNWLAKAISFVLDDEYTREKSHGLVKLSRLGRLWSNAKRKKEDRYPPNLQRLFLRLMERFDISYQVAEPDSTGIDPISLIAQLVPDVRPESIPKWASTSAKGDRQQVQICRIVDTAKNLPATAEGLFYQLIVRLHKYSLGRTDYERSVHWRRGLVLEDDTGARALLEHIDTNVRITVRSPYPERFLSALTYEVKWLVESFWRGMRCEVTVPCLTTDLEGKHCAGLFDVKDLLDDLGDERSEQKCYLCKKWVSIEQLLRNAPSARPNPAGELLANRGEIMQTLSAIRVQLTSHEVQINGRLDRLDTSGKELVSKVEAAYTGLMHSLLDEAKEGPRLFSFEPAETGFFDRPNWISEKFRLTLWCEHSRLPLPTLNGKGSKRGVYELLLPRDWFVTAAPFLKLVTGTLSLVVPMTSSATKLVLDAATYKGIEDQLVFGQKCLESVLKGSEQVGTWLGRRDAPDVERGMAIEAHGALLRQLQVWLKEKDPSFGGLVRVMNKRQEFLWVHPQFEKEY